MFDCTEFHSEYQALEVTRHTPLSDKMSLHYFELPKLPVSESEEYGKELWLRLFSAETEEELAKIEALEVPIMKQAIGAYRQVTATPEFREIERLRSKARHDEAQALKHARLSAQREEREKWSRVVADAVAGRDAALADKDAEIEKLRKQLGER